MLHQQGNSCIATAYLLLSTRSNKHPQNNYAKLKKLGWKTFNKLEYILCTLYTVLGYIKILGNANWSVECWALGGRGRSGGISSSRLKLLGVMKHIIFLNMVMMVGLICMSDPYQIGHFKYLQFGYVSYTSTTLFQEFLEGPVVKTCTFYCCDSRIKPWLGELRPHLTESAKHHKQ